MERLGIVGLPNAGKSSLFNALTGGSAVVAPHPFSTTETNVGVAHVPDHRLDALAEMSKSRKVVPATVEFVDIAGLVAGRRSGEGLGNRFLAGIREVDALCLVLREPSRTPTCPATRDPLDDLNVLELELVLADVATVESQIDKRRKAAKGVRQVTAARGGRPRGRRRATSRAAPRSTGPTSTPSSGPLLRPFFLLTNKSVLAVVNLGEDQLADADAIVEAGRRSELGGEATSRRQRPARSGGGPARSRPSGRSCSRASAWARAPCPASPRPPMHLLGRRTFLTTGDKESRAWTFRAGAKAPECAGVIHSDLQRGFIRAEVIRWDELLTLGSWHAAKEAGKLRVEGKEYEVVDGDVLEIRFNV